MKPKWLFETDVFDENIRRVFDEVRAQGMEMVVASYAPYADGGDYMDKFKDDDCVIFYGSLNFAAQIKRAAPWIPGVWYNKPSYECTSYYPKLAPYLLNKDYIMLPYGDLQRQKDFLYEKLGVDGCIFVRPNSGSKIFTGKLIEIERYEKDVERLSYGGALSSDLCVVAPPVNIEDEWRFVVAGGKVITGSQYIKGGKTYRERGYPEEASELAAIVAGCNYTIDPISCLDICRTRGGDFHLLEIGCISCSGWYDCDYRLIVKEMSRLAVKEWESYHED